MADLVLVLSKFWPENGWFENGSLCPDKAAIFDHLLLLFPIGPKVIGPIF
jgi:hypothetical protein